MAGVVGALHLASPHLTLPYRMSGVVGALHLASPHLTLPYRISGVVGALPLRVLEHHRRRAVGQARIPQSDRPHCQVSDEHQTAMAPLNSLALVIVGAPAPYGDGSIQ
jgi:hypothetical protein